MRRKGRGIRYAFFNIVGEDGKCFLDGLIGDEAHGDIASDGSGDHCSLCTMSGDGMDGKGWMPPSIHQQFLWII